MSGSTHRPNRRAVLTSLRAALIAPVLAGTVAVGSAEAKSAREIDAEVAEALNELFAINPGARDLYQQASGVLVIPEVIKGSFIVGGAYGEGALLINGTTDSYWSYGAASLGLQAGAQKTRQVLFFMTPEALASMQKGQKAEVGVDFEATVIDAGGEAGIDTTRSTAPVIALVFGRKGLQAGASLAGGGYSRLIR